MDWREKWSKDRGWLVRWLGSSGRAERRLGSGFYKKIASYSRLTRATGDHQTPKGYEPSTLGTQNLTWTYLLVAIVCSLLLNAVRELGASIFGIVPCSSTWK